MSWTGLLHRLGGAYRSEGGDLANPLSVLGTAPTLCPQTSSMGRSEDRQCGPMPGDGRAWQYLIAAWSTVGNRRSWTLLGPTAGVAVSDNSTPEEVISALAEQGWRMLATSPPVHSTQPTINYIFRRLIP